MEYTNKFFTWTNVIEPNQLRAITKQFRGGSLSVYLDICPYPDKCHPHIWPTRTYGHPDIWQVLPSHNIFFAVGCAFVDFAIAVSFYPVIETLYIIFGRCSNQILNLRAKNNFANMVRII